jgi:hypothetical protein
MAYNSLTLVPAYGRDYKSKSALLQDWEAGKDFLGMDRTSEGYLSIRDVQDLKLQANITHLHFRYNKQTLVHVVKL